MRSRCSTIDCTNTMLTIFLIYKMWSSCIVIFFMHNIVAVCKTNVQHVKISLLFSSYRAIHLHFSLDTWLLIIEYDVISYHIDTRLNCLPIISNYAELVAIDACRKFMFNCWLSCSFIYRCTPLHTLCALLYCRFVDCRFPSMYPIIYMLVIVVFLYMHLVLFPLVDCRVPIDMHPYVLCALLIVVSHRCISRWLYYISICFSNTIN